MYVCVSTTQVITKLGQSEQAEIYSPLLKVSHWEDCVRADILTIHSIVYSYELTDTFRCLSDNSFELIGL